MDVKPATKCRAPNRGNIVRYRMMGAAIALSVLVPGALGVAAGSGQAADGPPNALALELNEAVGATKAQDSSGLGHHGKIGSHVAMKSEVDPLSPDGTGVTKFADFDNHKPGEGIDYDLDHLIVVPDAADGSLDPGTGDFTIEMRFRTNHSYGNVLQKGQAKTAGGQVKIQIPDGRLQCLFKSPEGRAGAATGTYANPRRFNDNRWHTLRCERTSQSVTVYVDGVRYGRVRKFTGNINNTKPWTLGGKSECDAVKVTCDYFPGEIDYVRMWKG